MKTLQETLESLQPYVIGIRYLEGVPLVDTIFKDGWVLPEDSQIKRMKGNDDLNYYMILSEVPGIGLDELLNYVEKTIKLNLEKEKKNELFKSKVSELKDLFKKTSLDRLKLLSFTFDELNEYNIDDTEEEVIESPITNQPITYLDENKEVIVLTEEEKEILAEEERGRRNLELQHNIKEKSFIKNAVKVELPPRQTFIKESDRDVELSCNCGEDEACEKCVDSK